MDRLIKVTVAYVAASAVALLVGCGGGSSPGSDVELPVGDVVSDAAADVGPDHSGNDSTTCQNSCPEEGAKDCFEGGIRTCADLDDDGCMEWSDPVACEQGKVCSSGACVSGCANPDCTAVGAKTCAADNQVVECGLFGAGDCLTWGNPVGCVDDLVCSRGSCQSECQAECTTIGAKKCQMNSVVTCGDYNTDTCLEWGDAAGCGDKYCANGRCVDKCENECTTIGARQCELAGYSVCDEYDGDGCLEWGTVLFCGQDQVCSNGFCGTECTPGCTVVGARKCQGNSVVVCNDYNEDACLEWGSPAPCADGLVCSEGNCASQCTNECTVAMARQCDEGGSVVVCNDYNEDGCLEWGSPTPCDSGLVCSGGNCSLTCSNDCQIANERQCVAGSDTKFRVCGDYNSDGCLEWGTPQDCQDSLICTKGTCAQNCENECTQVDGLKCVAGNGWSRCRDYNSDGCLEWGTAVYCESWQDCSEGACVDKEPPATIIINEVMIDTTGSPDIDSFVELWGPAGTDLTGWKLVGVNGSSGADYKIVDLVGQLGSDGLFVIAHPESQASIHDMGDMFAANVDYENGPDNIQIRFGTTTVDAIGYGTFKASHFFAGEGTAVKLPAANHSMARDLNHTDTDDNSADFKDLANPTPGSPNQDVNEPPVADLVCPPSGSLGSELTFDGSASDDPDGSIASFAFDFGDSTTPVSGLDSVVKHTYGQAGTFTVKLTVTDNRGASDEATCQISVGDDNAPTVDFIKPVNDTQVTQGSQVAVLVNPNPAPGRSISSVELIAGGTPTGMTDDSAPYEFVYAVPANQPNNTSLQLQAKAIDNMGSVGFGSVRLQVRNDVPVASFTAVVSGDKQVSVDASASRDTETATADLMVRWDFTADGTWDTDWSATKTAQYTYPADGKYTIKMEVRDGIGQTAALTREVTLSSIQYVGGTVTTTTWTGTIVITGDVTIPSGETLTVAAGTSVLFAYIDQNGDEIGDYDITVNGTILVNGTAAQPVLFTVYGNDARRPDAWNRLIISGTGSQIRNAIFEYASTAIESKKDVLVEDTVIRFSREGILSSAGSGASTLNRVSITDNTANGVSVKAGTLAGDECDISRNGGDGFKVEGGTLNLTDSTVNDNGAVGIEYQRSGNGTVQRNNIGGNGYEGVRVWSDSTSDPSPIINFNNIAGNATKGALVLKQVGVSVTTDYSYYGTSIGPVWTNPSGTTVLMIHVTYVESDSSYSYVAGSVRKDSGSGVEVMSTSTALTRWSDISSYGAKALVPTVADYNSGSYYGSMTVNRAISLDTDAVREISVITHSGTVDMRHNYLGTFPNVLDKVTLGSASAANIQGFVGTRFDSTWSKGIYFGGESISLPTTWMGTVYITGDLAVNSTTLTIQAGTQVLFAPVDQDGNGIGDFDLVVANSTFNVNGTSGDQVRFGTVGGTAKGYQEVKAYGSGTSTISHAVFENAYTGLHLETGIHSIGNSTFKNNFQQGVQVNANGSADSATFADCSFSSNNRGMLVESFRNLTVNRTVLENNLSDAINVTGSSVALNITNSTARNNEGNGIYLTNSTVNIDHCNIQYNAIAGVRYDGTSAGNLTNSNIKFNDGQGVLLVSLSGNPAPIINSNNLYGNSLVSGVEVTNPGISVTTDYSYYGTQWSSGWSTPGGQKIAWVRFNYTESDSSYSYVSGSLNVGSTSGQTVYSSSSAISPKVIDLSSYSATTIFVGVLDYNSGSYYGSAGVDVAMYPVSNVPSVVKPTELAAATDGGQVNCKGNYWGTFPNVQPRFSLVRSDAIDFQNFVGSEITSAGPLP